MNSNIPDSSPEQQHGLEAAIEKAASNPSNLGEMPDADAVGTVGNSDCGDMLRMWVKFTERDGRRVIDRASFQSFGCQTAVAVASVATELIRGKTADEALDLRGNDLAAPLGALPPMKIHCAKLVEDALRAALAPKRPDSEVASAQVTPSVPAPAGSCEAKPGDGSLLDTLNAGSRSQSGVRIRLLSANEHQPL